MADFLSRGTNRVHMTSLLEAYLRHPEWEEDFERALDSAQNPDALVEAVVALLNAGADRALVRNRLEAFHLQLMSQDRDEDDDTVLEVLDRMTQYANPHQRI